MKKEKEKIEVQKKNKHKNSYKLNILENINRVLRMDLVNIDKKMV
jgi:hypothetical protein